MIDGVTISGETLAAMIFGAIGWLAALALAIALVRHWARRARRLAYTGIGPGPALATEDEVAGYQARIDELKAEGLGDSPRARALANRIAAAREQGA